MKLAWWRKNKKSTRENAMRAIKGVKRQQRSRSRGRDPYQADGSGGYSSGGDGF